MRRSGRGVRHPVTRICIARKGHGGMGSTSTALGAVAAKEVRCANSVAAGRVGEGGGGGGLPFRPLRIEETEDAANCPISNGDSKYECHDNGEEQQDRQKERRHNPLILQAEVGIREGWHGGNRGLTVHLNLNRTGQQLL